MVYDVLGFLLPILVRGVRFWNAMPCHDRAMISVNNTRVRLLCAQVFTGFGERQGAITLKPIEYVTFDATCAKALPAIFPDCQAEPFVFIVKWTSPQQCFPSSTMRRAEISLDD